MRWPKCDEKPREFLNVIYNLTRWGREMVHFNILAKECQTRPVNLQKIVNEYAKEGLVRYEDPNLADSVTQLGRIGLTNIGIAEIENV